MEDAKFDEDGNHLEHSHYTTLNLLKNLTVKMRTGQTLVRGDGLYWSVLFATM